MTLATRLRRLLDVLQQVHGIKRSVACRVVGDRCGVSYRYVNNLATHSAWLKRAHDSKLNHTELAAMEQRYMLPLRYLTAYENACERHATAAFAVHDDARAVA